MKRIAVRLSAILLTLLMLLSPASALSVEQALTLLEEYYVRELPAAAYEADSLEALFEAVGDPYTYYMDGETYREFIRSMESPTESVVGIGVSIQFTEQGILVVGVTSGGPAERAGIQAGDVIVAADGVSCVPGQESHRTLIVGEEGTLVTVTVLRDGALQDYTLRREQINVPNTTVTRLDGHIGYINCTSFGSETGRFFREGMGKLEDSVDSWLLDLRYNSGGLTSAAADAMSCFTGAGYYVYMKDREGKLYASSCFEERVSEKPVVVLVSGYTASSAEAVAGDLRDLRRGIVIGSRTYGKGVAQVMLDKESEPDYFTDDAVKITGYRFYSVGGAGNDRVGVIPTLLVDDAYAYEIGRALCGTIDPWREDSMYLELLGQSFPLNWEEMSREAGEELLRALPSCARLWIANGVGGWVELTLQETFAQTGLRADKRSFTDVGHGAVAERLELLANYRIISGVGGGKFNPDGTLTRAEACTMLARAFALSLTGEQRFTDVEPGSWYAPYVNAMAAAGLAAGDGEGGFLPRRTITAQEFAAMLGRMLPGLHMAYATALANVNDSDRTAMANLGFSPYARDYAAVFRQYEMLPVDEEHTARQPITRQRAAEMLYSVLVSAGILPQV